MLVIDRFITDYFLSPQMFQHRRKIWGLKHGSNSWTVSIYTSPPFCPKTDPAVASLFDKTLQLRQTQKWGRKRATGGRGKDKGGGVTWGSMGRCMAEASEELPLENGSEERGGRGGCLGGGAIWGEPWMFLRYRSSAWDEGLYRTKMEWG